MLSYAPLSHIYPKVHPLRPADLHNEARYKSFVDLFRIAYNDGNQRYYDIVKNCVIILPMDTEKPPMMYEHNTVGFLNEMNRGIQRILHQLPPGCHSFKEAIEYIRNHNFVNIPTTRELGDPLDSCYGRLRVFDGRLCSDEFLSKNPYRR